jgi:homocitrate synthase NifV
MDKGYAIIDSTLREGEQTPGVLFSPAEKREIIKGLVRVGVDEVELGIASRFHPCVGALTDYCRREHPGLGLSLWSRCRQEDIETAAEWRPDILSLSIPVSDIHLEKRLGKGRTWAFNTMRRAMELAERRGLTLGVGFEDASRSDLNFLLAMAKEAERLGAVRVRLADTLGIATPTDMARLVAHLDKILTTCAVAVHTHNDFGMATANALAALEAGARFVDTVVLGLGERTGGARLEEVVGYLCLVQGNDQFRVEHLKPLARYVAGITGRKIEGNRPIVGEDIFTCETGLHLQGLQRDPKTYEPFDPERVSGKRKLLLGPKSGRRAIIGHMTELDKHLGANLSEDSIEKIRGMTKALRRPLTEGELLRLSAPYSERKES